MYIVSVKFCLSCICHYSCCPTRFPFFLEDVCIPEQFSVCCSSMPLVRKTYNMSVHRYLMRRDYISDSAIQTQKMSENGRADFQLPLPQDLSPDKNNHGRLCIKNAAQNTWEITSGMVLILCYFTSQFCVG